MPDDITETTASVATTVETAAIPAAVQAEVAKTFSQEQVNAIVQQRLAADRATRSKPEPVKQEPIKQADKPADSDLRAELDEMKLRNAFDKRIGKFDVSDQTAERLFKLYKVENPEDPAAWIGETAKEFGLKSPAQPFTQAQVATATIAPTPAPQTAAAPNAPVRVDGITNAGIPDLFQLTPAAMDQMGPAGMRAIFEQATSLGRQLSGAPNRPKLPTQR